MDYLDQIMFTLHVTIVYSQYTSSQCPNIMLIHLAEYSEVMTICDCLIDVLLIAELKSMFVWLH